MEAENERKYRGSLYRNTAELRQWHAGAIEEEVIEPELPIIDPHHHTYDDFGGAYQYPFDDLRNDLDSGHRIVGTVYVEGYSPSWYPNGPEHLRPVGEIKRIVDVTREPWQLQHGPCDLAAGIVGFIDLTLEEDKVDQVLQAYREASGGRVRGVRHRAVYDGGVVGRYIIDAPKQHILADPAFRRGFARLASYGLCFDSWLYHPQLDDLIGLAEEFPKTPIVVNHAGGLIGVEEYARDRSLQIALWKKSLHALAELPNVFLKIGALGMPVFGFGFEYGNRPPTSRELEVAWKPLIDSCIEAFGPERCMLESDFPVDMQTCGYRQLWNAFKLATRSLAPAERANLFHKTACRAYDLQIEGI
jgi:L-fuconolactonase